jgi:3-isopropylmalate dehydrogenase
MKARIVTLPGDGISPEIVAEAVKVLKKVAQVYGHTFEFCHALVGGAAIDATGDPLPAETLKMCLDCDGVLLGAVGDPKYDDPRSPVRPEQGLLALRKGMGVFANLRPVKLYKQLLHASTIKPEIIEDVDLVVVRELTGGLYFGERGRKSINGTEAAYDTMFYTAPEVERVARVAFELARKRRSKVTSVDKANVLESSRLWRETATRVAQEYPDVKFESMYVDIAAMRLMRYPNVFDVIVTNNMFGDILTDEASMIAGSMGMLPSGAIGASKPGLFEPIHGSAPKYTGQNVVNPIATILSAAMLLRHSLELEEEAQAIESAVQAVLEEGYRTKDIQEEESTMVGTREMGDLIAERIEKPPEPTQDPEPIGKLEIVQTETAREARHTRSVVEPIRRLDEMMHLGP